MAFGNRVLNETIMPVDANQWDTAYTKSASAVQNTDFDRILTPSITSGNASALTVTKNGYTVKDMGVLIIKLHVEIGSAATISVNGSAAAGIYTSNGLPVVVGTITKDAIVGLVYNVVNTRWYILGGGGGSVTANTLIDTVNRREAFVGNGTNKIFTFVNGSYQMGANRIILVAVSGIVQQMITSASPDGSWREITNKSITFTVPPPNGEIVDIYYIDHVYGDNINLGDWT